MALFTALKGSQPAMAKFFEVQRCEWKNGSCELYHAHLGWFIILKRWIVMISPNLMFLSSPIIAMRMAMPNVQNGVVRSHSRSPAMYHTSLYDSYSTLIDLMHLSYLVPFLRLAAGFIYRKLILTYPTFIWGLDWLWPCSNFAKFFGITKLVSLSIVWLSLRDPT